MLFNYHIVILPVVRSVYRDAKCGKIQCQGGANRPVIGTNAVSIETNIPMQEGGRILCRGTHVYLGDDMPDPGLVLTGTKCGDGMVRAVPAKYSQYRCTCNTQINSAYNWLISSGGKYTYSSTPPKYNIAVLIRNPLSATLYFHSTTFQREILHFLLHYIYLTAGFGWFAN